MRYVLLMSPESFSQLFYMGFLSNDKAEKSHLFSFVFNCIKNHFDKELTCFLRLIKASVRQKYLVYHVSSLLNVSFSQPVSVYVHTIPWYCHLPVGCRSVVDQCGSLGNCKSQIFKNDLFGSTVLDLPNNSVASF